MSRYNNSFTGQPTNYDIYVGWDRALQTFFGQAFDNSVTDEQDDCIFTLGQKPGEITTIEELVNQMAKLLPGFRLWAINRDSLIYDQRTQGPDTLSALQQRILKLIQENG